MNGFAAAIPVAAEVRERTGNKRRGAWFLGHSDAIFGV
jgi:hypothetical protein